MNGVVRALAAVTAALAVGTAAPAAGGAPASAVWQAPTAPHGAAFTVTAGSTLTIRLAAASGRIEGVELPAGSSLGAQAGMPASATFRWRPTLRQAGQHLATFRVHLDESPAPLERTYVLWVSRPLSRPLRVSRWAFVERPVVARTHPDVNAPAVARVGTRTPEGTQNVLLALAEHVRTSGERWLQVRLAKLPNNTTAWVPEAALSPLRTVRTHLVVDRRALRATLYKSGRVIFRTRVGVGLPYWPTPRGEFYVRVRVTGFTDPMYGPLAFGLSARSGVLTDWPGGGFIGIHGTNRPELLPGRVSHGCIRIRNDVILRLARLMPIGTPVSIR